MPDTPSYPGLYVEEVPTGVRAIAGVATSIALFIGWAAKGPIGEAVRIAGFADYERKFGGLDARALLGYSVRHFFENGGTDAYVIRIAEVTGPRGAATAATAGAFHTALEAVLAEGGAADRIDLFNIVCVPGLVDAAAVGTVQAYAKKRRAFLVVDCEETLTAAEARTAVLPTGDAAANSAYYFPWVLAPDPLIGGAPRAFPPCGFVAGIYARTDATRGVWKAPAGVEATIRSAAGLVAGMSDSESGRLNARGINCLRTFPVYGDIVWGARTLHGEDALGSEWKYVPVRRLALFIEESLARGTQWAVFEPNDEPLWSQLRLGVGAFLHDLFRQGAFQGRTPRDAYFVKCDRETNAQPDIETGGVNILVGFAPLKPAEFVLIRIRQKAGPPGS